MWVVAVLLLVETISPASAPSPAAAQARAPPTPPAAATPTSQLPRPPLGTRRGDEAGRIARDHQPAVRGLELGHECGAGLLSASPDLRGEGEDIL